MGFIAAAALAATIGGVSSVMAADSQRRQANRNRAAQEKQNLINYGMAVQQRGGDASAIFQMAGMPELAQKPSALLPMYAPSGTEARLLEDALATSKAIGAVPPETSLAEFTAIVNQMQPGLVAGDRLINDIFTGGVRSEREASLAPVLAARTRGAEAERSAVDLAVQNAMNRAGAEEARKGFVGAGSFGRNRMLEAAIPGYQQAARTVAAADVQNQMEKRALAENDLQLRLASINAPIQRAAQRMSLATAPERAVVERQITAQEPLKFFRLNPTPLPEMRAAITQPYADAGASALGSLAQGIGGVAGAYSMNQAANRMGIQNRMMASNQMPDNWGTLTTGQQNDYLKAWNRAQGIDGSPYE